MSHMYVTRYKKKKKKKSNVTNAQILSQSRLRTGDSISKAKFMLVK